MDEAVKNDIMSYSPTISHYRREHAPNVLYLPTDLTCQAMYDSFHDKRLKQSLESCSYSFYNKKLNKMNIRFTKLGHELCERCREAEIHMKLANHVVQTTGESDFLEEGYPEADRCADSSADDEEESSVNPPEDCVKCLQWQEHKNVAIRSRCEYDRDKTMFNGLAVSVDLQKVIQLPRMEGFKEVIFSRRIIAMNETFAPLGGQKKGPTHAVVWNEIISGRKACDIISSFTQNLLVNKDQEHILYWLDNCSSQNKNWDLMLHMILIVNSSMISTRDVTFKYLESGHTFMSADAFHAAVERRMRLFNKGEIPTYPDFVNCIKQANGDPEPIVTSMEYNDFFEPTFHFKPSVISRLKDRPKLANIKTVKFSRGSYEFHYRNDFSTEWKHCSVFTNKQLKQIRKNSFDFKLTLKYREACTGIEKSRKDFILRKLCSLMPAGKRTYWQDLPEVEVAEEF
ncbi:uncharacterized protein LOC129720151 [Wyeomyia smithii]|uniref:uncharacterized protein LOC129720151 n=1 Tax=Wyeomyia smithii TaxID=174621 RepID=UPI002467B7D2|nr:uncharacterized protein LOC129720151 [Wyeomyia smithii]